MIKSVRFFGKWAVVRTDLVTENELTNKIEDKAANQETLINLDHVIRVFPEPDEPGTMWVSQPDRIYQVNCDFTEFLEALEKHERTDTILSLCG